MSDQNEPAQGGALPSVPLQPIVGPTSPDRFAKEMKAIREEEGGDYEIAHEKMDNIMCRVLLELGYRDGVAFFNEQKKWYA